MNLTWDKIDSYGLSPELWRKFALPSGGSFETTASGNPAIGFFDHFMSFHATTLEGPYRILEGTGCAVEQIADTGNSSSGGFGLLQVSVDGNAANDEAVLQWGRGLCAPFKLAGTDLCFEARLKVSAITAAKWSWAIGLGETGMGATDGLFVDTTGALADKNFLGFVHLQAEGSVLDGAYKADGQTYQDGATKAKLDTLHTLVADTFVKVGFRYQAYPQLLRWYVNGVEKAKLFPDELNAATFPDDVFLAPIVGIKDIAGNAALNLVLDWWACAQAL